MTGIAEIQNLHLNFVPARASTSNILQTSHENISKLFEDYRRRMIISVMWDMGGHHTNVDANNSLI
jgi:hypothetical protein